MGHACTNLGCLFYLWRVEFWRRKKYESGRNTNWWYLMTWIAGVSLCSIWNILRCSFGTNVKSRLEACLPRVVFGNSRNQSVWAFSMGCGWTEACGATDIWKCSTRVWRGFTLHHQQQRSRWWRRELNLTNQNVKVPLTHSRVPIIPGPPSVANCIYIPGGSNFICFDLRWLNSQFYTLYQCNIFSVNFLKIFWFEPNRLVFDGSSRDGPVFQWFCLIK